MATFEEVRATDMRPIIAAVLAELAGIDAAGDRWASLYWLHTTLRLDRDYVLVALAELVTDGNAIEWIRDDSPRVLYSITTAGLAAL